MQSNDNNNYVHKNTLNIIGTCKHLPEIQFIGYNPHNPWIEYQNLIYSTNTFIR